MSAAGKRPRPRSNQVGPLPFLCRRGMVFGHACGAGRSPGRTWSGRCKLSVPRWRSLPRTYTAYQNYFSTDETCHKLRINIISVMERNVAPETKRSLLRKDVTEFDK